VSTLTPAAATETEAEVIRAAMIARRSGPGWRAKGSDLRWSPLLAGWMWMFEHATGCFDNVLIPYLDRSESDANRH
jgi:hypothetical protein